MSEIRTDFADQETIEASDFNKAMQAIKGSTPGTELHRYNETPSNVIDGTFKTAVPFRSGTSQVYWAKERQIKGIDYDEDLVTYAPDTAIAFIAPHPGALQDDPNQVGQEIRIDYVWSDPA